MGGFPTIRVRGGLFGVCMKPLKPLFNRKEEVVDL